MLRVIREMNLIPRMDEDMIRESQQLMDDHPQFSHCVGYIDGCMFYVNGCRGFKQDLYSGYKKRYCLNVQAIVNERGDAIFTSYRALGRANDGMAMVIGGIHEELERWEDLVGFSYVLADGGYGLTRHVIPRIRQAAIRGDPRKIAFNRELSSKRSKIEHLFGWVKGRFPLLSRRIPTTLKTATLLIHAGFSLHNLILRTRRELGLRDEGPPPPPPPPEVDEDGREVDYGCHGHEHEGEDPDYFPPEVPDIDIVVMRDLGSGRLRRGHFVSLFPLDPAPVP